VSIKFYKAEDIQRRVAGIVGVLGLEHVDMARVVCVRSIGSAARRTLARCYALPKIWQVAMDSRAYYLIEVISEHYDKLSEEDKDKVLIHELMHIPNTFGGGFRHHGDHVTERNVERMHAIYRRNLLKKRESEGSHG
jgi:predicted metallopeptidase